MKAWHAQGRRVHQLHCIPTLHIKTSCESRFNLAYVSHVARSVTSSVTEAQGGGSHTAVMPAAPISAARPASTAYQGGCGRCAHSQLNPCASQAQTVAFGD